MPNFHYSYNKYGQQTEMAWRSRVFQPTSADPYENVTTYTYDLLGRLKTVTAVERNNALVDVDSTATGIQPDTTTHTYDLVGNLERTKYSNGLIHDYDYDSLNRLDELYHWKDKADSTGHFNGQRDPNEILAEFDYELRADGKRTGVTEKFSSVGGVDAAFATNDFSWEYDAAGRLISETADASGGSLFNDYSETFVYDLTGNRVKQTKVSGNSSGNGSTTETADYVYDANDRLLIETNTVGSDEKTSVYTYNKTQQTETETTEYEDGGLGEPVTITTTQTFEYDLQGKLSKSTTTRDGGQALGSDGNSSTVYEYDSAGNRIAATTTRQNTVGGSTTTRIEYLTDSENPTGYSQVLTETEFAVTVDANGNEVQTPIKEVVYTIGHDQISQTIFTPSPTGESWGEGSTQHFGTDGHGSVRVLYDAVAAIAQNATGHLQVYHFDAYGNLLNENSVGKALTVYLYSGEAFDFNIGLQYLRARLYDPNTGRFVGLDPFSGNSSDPQSFHKYAYVHGDPIQGVDPTGMFQFILYRKRDLAVLALFGAIVAGLKYRAHLHSLRIQANDSFPGAMKSLEISLSNTQNDPVAKDQARRMVSAIRNTFELNVREALLPNWGDDERQKNIFCAEWVVGFHNAAQFEIDESNDAFFRLEQGAAMVKEEHEPGKNRIHVWLKIIPLNGEPPIYVDDAFADNDGAIYDPNNKFIHRHPPIPAGYDLVEDLNLIQEPEWTPPQAYDSSGNLIQDAKYQRWRLR